MVISLQQAWPEPSASHVESTIRRLVTHFNPLRVLILGSYARGQASAGSDLDFLVVLPEVENKREAAIAMRRVLSDLPVPVDVFVTTPDEIEKRGWIVGSLLQVALKEGKIIHERSENTEQHE